MHTHLVLQLNLILYRGIHLIKNLEGVQEIPIGATISELKKGSVALLHLPQPKGAETEGITSQERDILNSNHRYVKTNMINLYCPTLDCNSILHGWRTILIPCLRGFTRMK